MPSRPPSVTTFSLAVGLVAATVVLTAAAQAATQTFTQPTPLVLDHTSEEYISIGDSSGLEDVDDEVAASAIDVDAPTGSTLTVVDVSVDLLHDRPDDLDLVLVSPSGQAATLMSDAGGDGAVDGTVTFTMDGKELPPDGDCSPCDLGFVGYSDYDSDSSDVDDVGVAGVPPSPTADAAALGGSVVDGAWTLYVADDTPESAATITGWSMDLYYALPATIPPAGTSPSTLALTGVPAVVTDVDLIIHGLTAARVSDLQVVLESPDGRRAHVLSDLVPTAATDLDLTLDDEATSPLPDEAGPPAPTSGSATYRPADRADGDPFEWVGGFDTAALPSALSTFDGASANGTWKLYVEQEWCCSTGGVTGWSLRITTADQPMPPPPPPPAAGQADATPPAITRAMPKQRARHVRREVSPAIRFSEPMDPSTLTRRTVRLVALRGDRVRTAVSYRANRRKLIVDPRRHLRGGTTYVLRLRGARDLAGNALAAPRTIRFTTKK